MKTYTYPSGLVIRENLSEMVEQFKKTAPAKMQKVVKKNAFVIQAEAARDAPVDTGTLKNSIIAEPSDNPNIYNITDGVEYGVFQELGTGRGKYRCIQGWFDTHGVNASFNSSKNGSARRSAAPPKKCFAVTPFEVPNS